jgi:hypothetical protein
MEHRNSSELLKPDDSPTCTTWITAWDAKSFNPQYLRSYTMNPHFFISSIDSTHQILQNI